MTEDEGLDEPAGEPGEDSESVDDEIEVGGPLTPEQAENIRLAMAHVPKINIPSFMLPESMLKGFANPSWIVEAQQAMVNRAIQPILDVQAAWQGQIAATIASDAFKNIAWVQSDLGRIATQVTRNIDFGGIAESLEVVARIGATFAEQQSALFKNLGPAIEVMLASFYPPNLRAIDGLELEDVNTVVMVDGIPLYGAPRTATAEALICADGTSQRREILGRRWKTISADCRGVVLGCASGAVAPYIPFAVAALDALDAGHTAAAQALAGSLVDAIVTAYFGKDRYKYTPSKRTPTSDAYDEFTIREFVAFAPMWQAYQQFFVSNGDKVPTSFSRNATAHTVSPRQFNRRNAVQGLMLACSLLYRLDEEAVAFETAA